MEKDKETEREMDEDAYEDIKSRLKPLEYRLTEFIDVKDVEYLRNWSFEYADRLAHRLNIGIGDRRYVYLQTLSKYELLNSCLTKAHEFNQRDTKNEYLGLEMKLPKHGDIDRLVEYAVRNSRLKLPGRSLEDSP